MAAILFLLDSLANKSAIKPASSSALLGSKYKLLGPPASARQEPFAAITGVSECSASMIGMPKPSNLEG